MSRSALRTSLIALLMTGGLIAGASLARASDPLWIFASCTQGSLASASDGGQDNVVVVGSAGFCGLHILNSKFGVAVFKAGQASTNVLSYRLRSMPLLGKRQFGIEVARGESGTFGVCLVGSPTAKVACAKIVFDSSSGYVEFTTIQPTDSLVNAKITGASVAVDPRCAACF